MGGEALTERMACQAHCPPWPQVIIHQHHVSQILYLATVQKRHCLSPPPIKLPQMLCRHHCKPSLQLQTRIARFTCHIAVRACSLYRILLQEGVHHRRLFVFWPRSHRPSVNFQRRQRARDVSDGVSLLLPISVVMSESFLSDRLSGLGCIPYKVATRR